LPEAAILLSLSPEEEEEEVEETLEKEILYLNAGACAQSNANPAIGTPEFSGPKSTVMLAEVLRAGCQAVEIAPSIADSGKRPGRYAALEVTMGRH